MSEAKDWAGELISGQTGTGRILVSWGPMLQFFVTNVFEVTVCPEVSFLKNI
jgi:hypothetical protein